MNRLKPAIMTGWCVLLIFASGGCIKYVGSNSSRSNLSKETVSQIIPQKSTKEDVLSMLGQPDKISADGKQFVYFKKYELAVIFPGGGGSGRKPDPANRYLLIIEFDEKDIVSRRDFAAPYEFHDKPVRGVPPFNSPPLYR